MYKVKQQHKAGQAQKKNTNKIQIKSRVQTRKTQGIKSPKHTMRHRDRVTQEQTQDDLTRGEDKDLNTEGLIKW